MNKKLNSFLKTFSSRVDLYSVRLLVLTLFLLSFSVGCENQFEERIIDPMDKTIALTFDDGPDPVYTAMILDVLKEKGVKASFFLVGNKMKQNPKVTERIYKEGHCMANHTMTHVSLLGKSFSSVSKGILQTEKMLDSICGGSSKLFRPPWGEITKEQKVSLKKLGFKIILWDVNSEDFKAKITVNDIVYNVMKGAGDKRIILFHDSDYLGKAARKNTALALPQVIDFLKGMGYHFVTISEMED